MKKTSLTELIASMLIFGTIGVFVRYINMPSGFIAMIRGALGVIFAVAVAFIGGNKPKLGAIKSNLPILIYCGAAIGINWILLFESYRYTTVATATLCYYMAPIFVILISPLILGERIDLKKILCVVCALLGMVFVSGVLDSGITSAGELVGIALGLGAALLYASVTVMNKKLRGITASERTAPQLLFATLIIIPYTLIFEEISKSGFTKTAIFMLLILGIVHTGVAYMLYFASIKGLNASTAAIFAYVDPIVAILLSALLLEERITPLAIVGAVLIILSALASELPLGEILKSIKAKGKKAENQQIDQ